MSIDTLQTFVEQVRNRIEPYWSDDLLYEKFNAQPADSKSAGYCGPSSIYLWEELQRSFLDETFSLAVGRVYRNSEEYVRGKHVWVMWHQQLKTSIVIDITADQSGHAEQLCVVESIDDLARQGINYVAYQLAKSAEEVDGSPMRRARLLREKAERYNG